MHQNNPEELENSALVEDRIAERTRELAQANEELQSMVRSLEAQRDRLEQLANRDLLTELHNHQSFQEQLDSELSRASRYHHDLSVLLVDVDRFKDVNLLHGYPAGDAVLRQVAAVLKRLLRRVDVLARYSEDEFAVILPETDAVSAARTAERIRKEIGRMVFVVTTERGETREVKLTVTVGVSNFPRHALTREGLLMAADIAIYTANHTSDHLHPYTSTTQDG